jgi:hypothetical protein
MSLKPFLLDGPLTVERAEVLAMSRAGVVALELRGALRGEAEAGGLAFEALFF